MSDASLSAVMDDDQRLRRRNLRLAAAFGVAAAVFYVTLFVVYLAAAR